MIPYGESPLAQTIYACTLEGSSTHQYAATANIWWILAKTGFEIELDEHHRSDWYSICAGIGIMDQLLDSNQSSTGRLDTIYQFLDAIQKDKLDYSTLPQTNEFTVFSVGSSVLNKHIKRDPSIMADIAHLLILTEAVRHSNSIEEVIRLRQAEGKEMFSFLTKCMDTSSFSAEQKKKYMEFSEYMSRLGSWGNLLDSALDLKEDNQNFFQSPNLVIGPLDYMKLYLELMIGTRRVIDGPNWKKLLIGIGGKRLKYLGRYVKQGNCY